MGGVYAFHLGPYDFSVSKNAHDFLFGGASEARDPGIQPRNHRAVATDEIGKVPHDFRVVAAKKSHHRS